jgi:signal transduction histidine kinase/ActR/RegA family two-component response regulator
MDSALPETVGLHRDPAREARIAQRTDARCLAHMLLWMRRTAMLVPVGLLWTYMAIRVGAGWWAVVWFVAWAGNQIHAHRLAGRLQADGTMSPRDALARATIVFWIAGLLHAALIPIFFVDTDESAKLTVTLLAVWLAGPVVISASGKPWTYAGASVPGIVVLAGGWLWHGDVIGYALAFLCAGALAPSFMAVRLQRRSWEELVRLLDDNEVLAASLKAERDRAEAASEAKTRFFAAASHDLRQPLHALSINATTLELVANRSADALLKDLSQGIGSALRQSRGLLDGLLDISRLDAHAVQTRIVAHDLGTILTAVRHEYAALAAQQGLAFELDIADELPWVLTDADLLMRIIGNLVDNAIKFTPKGRVLLSARRDSPDHVLVQVSDTGLGIPQAERERVFEEFYQIGNPSRDRSKGLGLGLAIVQRTAVLLNIDLRLISEHGRGTTFELRMRSAAPCAAPETPVASGGYANTALSVLVVDDEPEVLASLCTYLRQIGWSACGVASGDEAERLVAEGFRADVVAVDFRLRGETGLQVIERLRAGNPGLPAVIVTGDTSPLRLREFAALAASVLNKPVDGERLARALADAAARRGGSAAAARIRTPA